MTDAARDNIVISSHQRAMRVPRKRIAELVAYVARREGARLGEVDVAVVSRQRIATLNRRWLGRRGATDVMSFDLSAPDEPLTAEIVVCADVAVAEARRRGHGPQRELLLYVAHGLLHLLGYDDAGGAAEARRMHARQEELLEAFLRGR
ncbi:MAG: rRNA maturation RNase YbeY [Phycisphaerae bacterium]|nr:rRNA maturation RNase YbeY [Phycisphaerae bacterium]